MRDVVVATSAAPTFFVPKAVGRRVLIDGGLVANNPTSLARAEAAQIWPGEDVIVVSLGTGTLQRRIPGAAAAGWGKAQWAARVIDCVFDGTSKATETVSRYTLTPDKYVRLQGGLSDVTSPMDAVSEAAFSELQQLGEQIANNAEGQLFSIIAQLKKAGAPLTATITSPPDGAVVPGGECLVEGRVQNHAGEPLYLFTGSNGTYWPAQQLQVDSDGRFRKSVNLGTSSPTATISLIVAHGFLADYISHYFAHAKALNYPGLALADFPTPLWQVHVVVNLAKKN